MPPRRPPPPGPLTLLSVAAALVAAWLSFALDQLLRGSIGALVGVPWHGVRLSPESSWTIVAVQGSASGVPAGGIALMLLAGAAVLPLIAWGLVGLALAFRSSGWLRSFALSWLAVACIWGPTELAAAALGGAGPAAELYARLGEPQAGRWAALGLGIAVMLLIAEPLSRWAVTVGGAWMRADSLEFRRRLVRAVAGWPGACAAFALLLSAGWDRTPWALLWPGVVLVTLQVRTR